MQPTVSDLLSLLYGDSQVRAVLPHLQEMIRRRASSLGAAAANLAPRSCSERDALLIAYPDQVQEIGAPPLQTLAYVLDTYAVGLLSGVHLLPFYPYSSDDGFSVVDYYSVNPAFGRWKDVAHLAERRDLMFDAVINHVSAESDWFQRFLMDDPAYHDYFVVVDGKPDLSAVVRPRTSPLLNTFRTPYGEKQVWTTFSSDQIDLNYRNPQVLLRILDVLLFYVERGARFLRLDAVAYLWKEPGTPCIHQPQTHAIIQLIRAVLDEVAPGVMLVTETNVPHEENIAYFGDGTNEAQMVYNFALPPLVLHTFQTGDSTRLLRWAQGLTPPGDRATFFNFLASHDGIGLSPARGLLTDQEIQRMVARTKERGGLVSFRQGPEGSRIPYELNINYFDALSDPNDGLEPMATQVNRFIAAQAIMLSLAGVPGIYFHSLFGSRGDRAAAEASGIPRRINRQKLRLSELKQELGDPTSLRAMVLARLEQLLHVRREQRAFHPNGLQHAFPCGERVLGLLRVAPDGSERVLCLHNVANASVSVRLMRTRPREAWQDLIGGRVHVPDETGLFTLDLKPYEVIWAKLVI